MKVQQQGRMAEGVRDVSNSSSDNNNSMGKEKQQKRQITHQSLFN